MNQKFDQQAIYVLNRRAYSESSLILDVFTLQYGRFSIIAKGALRNKNAWSALLQVFQPLLATWSGRSSMKTLCGAEAPTPALSLKADRLYCGYYLNELILKLVPESEACPYLFTHYVNALQSLSEDADLEVLLRAFEVFLLRELGLAPDFSLDILHDPIEHQSLYLVNHQQGFECLRGVHLPIDRFNSGQLKHNGDRHNKLIIHGDTLHRLQLGNYTQYSDFENQQNKLQFFVESKRLTRFLINEALGGQAIRSREFFNKIKY
jgi:DNA repair protein RecO (recombination protein O)